MTRRPTFTVSPHTLTAIAAVDRALVVDFLDERRSVVSTEAARYVAPLTEAGAA